jgi:hypothetical protein
MNQDEQDNLVILLNPVHPVYFSSSLRPAFRLSQFMMALKTRK